MDKGAIWEGLGVSFWGPLNKDERGWGLHSGRPLLWRKPYISNPIMENQIEMTMENDVQLGSVFWGLNLGG